MSVFRFGIEVFIFMICIERWSRVLSRVFSIEYVVWFLFLLFIVGLLFVCVLCFYNLFVYMSLVRNNFIVVLWLLFWIKCSLSTMMAFSSCSRFFFSSFDVIWFVCFGVSINKVFIFELFGNVLFCLLYIFCNWNFVFVKRFFKLFARFS